MRIIALLGPRQTGKTTAALSASRHLEDMGYEYVYVSMDNPSGIRFSALGPLQYMDTTPPGAFPDGPWLVELWERVRQAAFQSKAGIVFVLDEIQKISNWSRFVKGMWDEDRRIQCPLHVVILGSAPWKMLTGLGESLLGRFERIRNEHWSYPEMVEAFGLTIEEYLFFGGYPGANSIRSVSTRLEKWREIILGSVLAPVLDIDIFQLTRVDKPEVMRQLIELAPRFSSQIVSLSKLMGELQGVGNPTTVARYLNLLSDAGLFTGLSRYSPAPHVGRKSPPKLNVLNTALMTASSGYSFEDAQADRSYWGRIVESAVGAHLYNTSGIVTHIHYWRTESQEVDFVVERGPRLLGIEVKSGRLRGLAGLKAFTHRFPEAKTMIVGTGETPLDEFLSSSADEWLDKP